MSHCSPNTRTSSANCRDWSQRPRRTGRLWICARRLITSARASVHNVCCGEATGQSSIWREDMPNGSLPATPYWPICHLAKRQMSSAAMRRASISQAGDDSLFEDDSLKMLQRAKRAASKLCLVRSLCDVCDSDRTVLDADRQPDRGVENAYFLTDVSRNAGGSWLRAGWQATRCR